MMKWEILSSSHSFLKSQVEKAKRRLDKWNDKKEKLLCEVGEKQPNGLCLRKDEGHEAKKGGKRRRGRRRRKV